MKSDLPNITSSIMIVIYWNAHRSKKLPFYLCTSLLPLFLFVHQEPTHRINWNMITSYLKNWSTHWQTIKTHAVVVIYHQLLYALTTFPHQMTYHILNRFSVINLVALFSFQQLSLDFKIFNQPRLTFEIMCCWAVGGLRPWVGLGDKYKYQ